MRFELQNKSLVRYLLLSNILGIAFISASLIPLLSLIFIEENVALRGFIITYVIIAVLLFLIALYATWYARQFANSLDYQLEDDVLYIEEGVFTYQRKAIPLDRVTDIRLVQNILMRWVGIWKVQVQTASSGEMGAEGTLWAIDSPKETRNQLLMARNTAVKSQSISPAT